MEDNVKMLKARKKEWKEEWMKGWDEERIEKVKTTGKRD